MPPDETSCARLIGSCLKQRLTEIRRAIRLGESPYPLFQELHWTHTRDTGEDYLAAVIGVGGPHDEFRFFWGGRVEYHLIWYRDRAQRDVTQYKTTALLRPWLAALYDPTSITGVVLGGPHGR